MAQITFDNNEYKFTINEKNVIHQFKCIELIKYITMSICDDFLNNVHCNSQVIEKYICKIENDSSGNIKIILLTPNPNIESCFMGNIDMIMKLFKGIHEFETTRLDKELSSFTPIQKKKIIGIIKQLIYLILNHSLKLILTLSNSINTHVKDNSNRELLLKYSVAIVYKLTGFMKDQIESKIVEYDELQNDLVRVGKIKLEMYKKINELNNSVNLQNKQINEIKNKLEFSASDMADMAGGTKNSSINNSTSKSTSKSTNMSKSESTNLLSYSNADSNLAKNSSITKSSDCYFTDSGSENGNIEYLSTSSKK